MAGSVVGHLPTWSFDENILENDVEESNDDENRITHDTATVKAEKIFLQPLETHLIAQCPTLDLIAVATSERRVDCFRFDGHRAFSHKRNVKGTIKSIGWTRHLSTGKFDDGVHLCVAWDDERVDFLTSGGERRVDISLLGVGRNRRVSKDNSLIARSGGPIAYVKSATYTHNARVLSGKTASNGSHRTNRAAMGTEIPASESEGSTKLVRDLAAQLSTLDILEELPPLGALTLGAMDAKYGHIDALAFTNKTAVDSLLNRKAAKINRPVNLLFAAHTDGSLRCTIDDAISAGQYSFGDSAMEDTTKTFLAHGSHTSHKCHSFLTVQNDANRQATISLNLISFSSLQTPTNTLPQIVQTTHLLMSHIQYITQTVLDLRQVFQQMHRLPGRLMENVAETMKEKGEELKLDAALYQLAVTGSCVDIVTEWMIDEVGPAQHKRWESSLESGYTTLKDTLLGCLLPAIDRTAVATSSLRVLARSNPTFLQIYDSHFAALTQRLDVLRLLAHSALTHTQSELAQFRVFSPWFLLQIQLQAAEVGSTTWLELLEKVGNVDYVQLLPYLSGAMRKSFLRHFLGGATADVSLVGTDGDASLVVSCGTLASIIRQLEETSGPQLATASFSSADSDDAGSVHLNFLPRADDLLAHAGRAAANLAKALQKGVDVLEGLEIERGIDGKIADVRTLAKDGDGLITTFVLTTREHQNYCVRIHRLRHHEAPLHRDNQSDNGWLKSWDHQDLRFTDREILGLKIVDDGAFVMLLTSSESSHLALMVYNEPFFFRPTQTPKADLETRNATCRTQSSDGVQHHHASVQRGALQREAGMINPTKVRVLQTFRHPNGIAEFVPAKIVVAAGEGRARNVLVLNKEGTRFKVYGVEAEVPYAGMPSTERREMGGR